MVMGFLNYALDFPKTFNDVSLHQLYFGKSVIILRSQLIK